jgi:hypothetical protein
MVSSRSSFVFSMRTSISRFSFIFSASSSPFAASIQRVRNNLRYDVRHRECHLQLWQQSDGAFPHDSLTVYDGVLYGTTESGGAQKKHGALGTVFTLVP